MAVCSSLRARPWPAGLLGDVHGKEVAFVRYLLALVAIQAQKAEKLAAVVKATPDGPTSSVAKAAQNLCITESQLAFGRCSECCRAFGKRLQAQGSIAG